MQAGKLRNRITFQRRTESPNVHGIMQSAWHDLKTVWAQANCLKGDEFWNAKDYGAEVTVEFVTRYFSGLTLQDRIAFRGKLYNIVSIDNFMFRNESLKIRATEVEE